MARIPRLMIYYKGERLVTMHVFSLPAPELAVAFSDDYTSCTVDVANRDTYTVYHYTLDGSEPDKTSPVLSGAILFDGEFTINVKAYRAGEESTVYTLEVVRTATPVVALTSTEDGGEVEISCGTDGARIEYGIKPPTVTLHNMVTVDTSEWAYHNGWGMHNFFSTSNEDVNAKFYLRGKFRYSSGTLTDCFLIEGGEGGTYVYNPVANTEYTLSVIEARKEGEHSTSTVNYQLGCHTFSSDKGVKIKECLLIDLTELYEAFPSFAAMSEADQKTILDTLPYFYGDMTLGGELENVELAFPDNNWNTYKAYGKYSEENGEKVITLDKGLPQSGAACLRQDVPWNLGDYYYNRITFKTSNQVDFSYYNFWNIEYEQLLVGDNLGGKNLSTVPLDWATESQLSKKNDYNHFAFTALYSPYNGYEKWPEGETAEVRFKESMLINLSKHGHYTLWRLMGLSNEDIKSMLDALPFFEDSYQGDVVLWQDYVEPFEIDGPRTVLARAYKDGMFVSDVASTTFERVATPLIEADWTEE